MEKYGYIYKFTYLPKNLIYVGKRKSKKFDNFYYGSGVMWKRIISGCNLDTDIKREIIEWCYSKQELNEREIFWIAELHATDHTIGCNVALGGEGGNLGEEVCKRISTTIQKHGTRKGSLNPAYGKHWFTNGIDTVFCEECPEGFHPGTGESINTLRKSHLKNKVRTIEQRKHYSEPKLGDRNPMKKLTGKNHPNHGKHCYTSPDGTISKYFYENEVPEGWIKGMRYNLTKLSNRYKQNNPAYNKHFYNNGTVQILDYVCPQGFVPGKLKRGGGQNEKVN